MKEGEFSIDNGVVVGLPIVKDIRGLPADAIAIKVRSGRYQYCRVFVTRPDFAEEYELEYNEGQFCISPCGLVERNQMMYPKGGEE